MLIFATQASATFLSTCEHWFMDGTFSVPPQFAQLYTVHGLKANRTIPCVYALLPNKREATYTEMCTQIRQFVPGQPQTILTDFERGAINAVANVYPNVTPKGCLFHLTSNVYKNVQRLGLQQEYIQNAQFRGDVQLISALPFVPLYDVVASFELILENAGALAMPVFEYFESTYIGPVRANVRQLPLFRPEFWSVWERVGELPRTNNAVEGWHNAFNQALPARNPDIWRYISAIKKEEALARMAIGQVAVGGEPPIQKRVYRRLTENLATVVADFPNRNRLDYLRGISFNLYRR